MPFFRWKRNSTGWFARADKLTDVLASAGALPEMLTRPDDFRQRFRPTLERLVDRYVEFEPVLSEFDRSTLPRRRSRPHKAPFEELWIDCGACD